MAAASDAKSAPASVFVGVDALIAKQSKQLAAFEKWAAAGEWSKFHSSHYDWWSFPLTERSSQLQYTIPGTTELNALADNSTFISNLRRGVTLLLQSWGWDVTTSAMIPSADRAADQKWHTWPVRLYKMGRSCLLFGTNTADLYTQCLSYAAYLHLAGIPLQYRSSHDGNAHHVIEHWREVTHPNSKDTVTAAATAAAAVTATNAASQAGAAAKK